MRLDNLPVAEMINFAFEDKPDKTMQIYNLGYALGGKLAVHTHTHIHNIARAHTHTISATPSAESLR
jgi:hypothetical protein